MPLCNIKDHIRDHLLLTSFKFTDIYENKITIINFDIMISPVFVLNNI